jgi:hypothetical protein
MGTHHDAGLVCTALQAAVATRGRTRMPDTIFHTDRGAEGGFNWSSQHLDGEELRWQQAGVGQLIGRDAPGCVPLGVRR